MYIGDCYRGMTNLYSAVSYRFVPKGSTGSPNTEGFFQDCGTAKFSHRKYSLATSLSDPVDSLMSWPKTQQLKSPSITFTQLYHIT